jgi:hypothetical protein
MTARRLCLCSLVALLSLASSCEPGTPPGGESRPGPAAAPAPPRQELPAASLPVAPPSLALEGERQRRVRVEPVEYVSQRLAFTRQRFAYLQGSEVIVHRLDDLAEVARFRVEDASNLVAVLGSDFLALGRERIHRLSAHEQRAEKLPRAPRVGLTTLWPSPRESEQFWLQYEGVPSLAAFDLKQASEGTLLPTGFVALPDFDRRALVVLTDTSVLYSAPDGLRRSVAGAPPERIALPELAGPIWRLLAADTPDRLWVLTPFHADLVALRPQPRLLERFELQPSTVAAASAGVRLALLALDGEPSERKLRVDVREIGRREAWTLYWVDAAVPAGAEPRPWPFEVALAPRGALVGLGANQVSVHDFLRGVAVLDTGRRR